MPCSLPKIACTFVRIAYSKSRFQIFAPAMRSFLCCLPSHDSNHSFVPADGQLVWTRSDKPKQRVCYLALRVYANILLPHSRFHNGEELAARAQLEYQYYSPLARSRTTLAPKLACKKFCSYFSSLLVASYDTQRIRWVYSSPVPTGSGGGTRVSPDGH